MSTYTIRIFTRTFFGMTSRDVAVEDTTPLFAAITGLERLAVHSLEHIAGIEICPMSEITPVERGEAIHGHHYD